MALQKCLICGKQIIKANVDGKEIYLDEMQIVSFKTHQKVESRYVSATMHVTRPEHFASGLCKPPEDGGQLDEDSATIEPTESAPQPINQGARKE